MNSLPDSRIVRLKRCVDAAAVPFFALAFIYFLNMGHDGRGLVENVLLVFSLCGILVDTVYTMI